MYTSPEEYLLELKEKLEEALMDMAALKQTAIKNGHYPTAGKFRDIEQVALRFLNKLEATRANWL